MRVSLLASLVLLTTVGCGHSLLSPGSLDGRWEWQFNRNPAGSSVSLSLTTAASAVSGTGTICGVGPETADAAVVKESDTLEPAGLRLNCHSHRPSRLPGERREWPQPTVVRSTSEASSETRMRTSALDSVGSYTS